MKIHHYSEDLINTLCDNHIFGLGDGSRVFVWEGGGKEFEKTTNLMDGPAGLTLPIIVK